MTVHEPSWFWPDADRRSYYISEVIAERGHINRADICDAFKVSVPQASGDLQAFIRKFPGLLAYNKSAKRYEVVGWEGGAA